MLVTFGGLTPCLRRCFEGFLGEIRCGGYGRDAHWVLGWPRRSRHGLMEIPFLCPILSQLEGIECTTLVLLKCAPEGRITCTSCRRVMSVARKKLARSSVETFEHYYLSWQPQVSFGSFAASTQRTASRINSLALASPSLSLILAQWAWTVLTLMRRSCAMRLDS